MVSAIEIADCMLYNIKRRQFSEAPYFFTLVCVSGLINYYTAKKAWELL